MLLLGNRVNRKAIEYSKIALGCRSLLRTSLPSISSKQLEGISLAGHTIMNHADKEYSNSDGYTVVGSCSCWSVMLLSDSGCRLYGRR
jgi:hypothetical protein